MPKQTHQEWLDGENEPTEQDKRITAFEVAAKKKGYSLDKDDVDRYQDNWLQEAWEIFSLINLNGIAQK